MVNVLSGGAPILRKFIKNKHLVTLPLSRRRVPERSLRSLEMLLRPMHRCPESHWATADVRKGR